MCAGTTYRVAQIYSRVNTKYILWGGVDLMTSDDPIDPIIPPAGAPDWQAATSRPVAAASAVRVSRRPCTVSRSSLCLPVCLRVPEADAFPHRSARTASLLESRHRRALRLTGGVRRCGLVYSACGVGTVALSDRVRRRRAAAAWPIATQRARLVAATIAHSGQAPSRSARVE